MCSTPGIPIRLHRRGRAVDSVFNNNELLYRRFKLNSRLLDEWEENPDAESEYFFPMNKDSYNRSKHSMPDDVLYNTTAISVDNHFFKWGIFEIKCSTVQGFTKSINVSGVNMSFIMYLSHSPSGCIYAHTEILIFDANTMTLAPIRPRAIKSAMRYAIFSNKTVIKGFED